MAVSYPIVSGAPIQLQPGFRFRPTDEEIVVHYLRPRALNEPLLPSAPIVDFDVLSHNPWELPDDGSEEKFYLSQRVPARWPRGNRCNRAAGDGHWKASGKDVPIVLSNGVNGVPLVVGLKMPFIFYRGNAPPVGEKTEWFMEEYSLAEAGLLPCCLMRPREGSSNLGKCSCTAAVIAKKNDELSEALRNAVAGLNMEPVMVNPDDSWVVYRIYQKKKSVPRALDNCYNTVEGGQVPFFYFLGQANPEGTASSGSHSGSPLEKENDETEGTE